MCNHLKRGNLLWEGSRMILPEHREALREHRRDSFRQTRPVLDDQQREQIDRAIRYSYANHAPIEIAVFGDFGNVRMTGIVTRIDRDSLRILGDGRPGDIRVNITDIIDVMEA